jgi:WD40-like Beta Propeller Repeat
MTINKGTLALGLLSPPYVMTIDGASGLLEAKQQTAMTQSGFAVALSPDNSKLGIASQASPYVNIYKTSDWTKIANPAVLPPAQAQGIAFSPDGSKLAVSHNNTPFLTVYNTADWTKIPSPAALPPGGGYGVAFSPNGVWLAQASQTTPGIAIYNVSDWSKVANPTAPPNTNCAAIAFSPDSSKLLIGQSTSPFLSIYNTSDWSKVANPAVLPNGLCFGIAFSPDGTKLAIAHSGGGPYLTLYNFPSLTNISSPVISNLGGITAGNDVVWTSNSELVLATNGVPGIIRLNVTSTAATIKSSIPLPAINAVDAVLIALWKIEGTLSESLAADTWVATAYDDATGAFVGTTTIIGGSTFSIPSSNPTPVRVTVAAVQGTIWEASNSITAGTKKYPTNPTGTPYYYVANNSGITAATEPAWPITAGGTVVDGNVTWQLVERLIEPSSQGPLIPVPA